MALVALPGAGGSGERDLVRCGGGIAERNGAGSTDGVLGACVGAVSARFEPSPKALAARGAWL